MAGCFEGSLGKLFVPMSVNILSQNAGNDSWNAGLKAWEIKHTLWILARDVEWSVWIGIQWFLCIVSDWSQKQSTP